MVTVDILSLSAFATGHCRQRRYVFGLSVRDVRPDRYCYQEWLEQSWWNLQRVFTRLY